jgi:gluconolactonase
MADIRVMATGLRFPEGPVAMADGSVILGEIAGSAVTRVASDGGKTVIGSAGGGPNGLARGPDGALYLCNNGRNECAQGGFLSTGPSKDYQCGHIRRINRRDGCLLGTHRAIYLAERRHRSEHGHNHRESGECWLRWLCAGLIS